MSDDSHAESPSEDERRRKPRRLEDQRLLQRQRELEVAEWICRALFQEINPDRLIEQSLKSALDVVGAEAGSILIADSQTRLLVFQHVVGIKADLLRHTAIPWDAGLAGAVFQSGQAEIIPDVKVDPRHYPAIDTLTGFQSRDMIVLPLKLWGAAPIGVLEVLNKREGRLTQEDVGILTIVSALSAAAIEQARLFEEAKLAAVVHRLADISHDVRNLLNPVFLSASLVHKELHALSASLQAKQDPSIQASLALSQEAIQTLREGLRRIGEHTQQVADCMKGLSPATQFAPCQLSEVVEHVVHTLHPLAEQQGVTLCKDGLDTLPPILADEQRLYTAFYNLVNNAIPEVPQGGTVTVRGRLDAGAGQVMLSVTDTGRGMPPEVRDSLFSGRAISRKVGGTGLGTKIVKDVVDAHGGTISVDSTEGLGTTFFIRLPLRPPVAKSA